MIKFDKIEAILFDLDGVLFIGDKPIEGAIKTINYLKSKNIPLRFLTNTTTQSFDSLFEKISGMGLPVEKSELFAPPKMAAEYLKKFGNPTVKLILTESTAREFESFEKSDDNPDYIVMGHFEDKWDYDLMQNLFDLVMNGSKMLALHKGRFWQTESGLTLDIGAFVIGLEHATGQKAVSIGKPSETFFKIALDDIGLDANDAIMIGDDLTNDIMGAQNAGIKAMLVKTGKFRQEILDSSDTKPDLVIESVAELEKLF